MTDKPKNSPAPDPVKQAKALYAHNKKLLQQTEAGKATHRPGTSGTHFTAKKQARYLNSLQESGEKALARNEVGVSRSAVADLRQRNSVFADKEEESLRIYRAFLAAEVHRRGKDGVQEPIYWNGVVVGWITKYSDKMLELHVKRHIPEYRDHSTVEQKLTGAVDVMADLSKLPPELRKELRTVLEKIKKCTGDGDGSSE